MRDLRTLGMVLEDWTGRPWIAGGSWQPSIVGAVLNYVEIAPDLFAARVVLDGIEQQCFIRATVEVSLNESVQV